MVVAQLVLHEFPEGVLSGQCFWIQIYREKKLSPGSMRRAGDLKLEERSIRHAGDKRLFLRDAGGLEALVAHAAQLVSAEEVTELVLVAEIFVPVGTEEEVGCFLARPPRLLEVVPELDVPGDEPRCDHRTRERRLPLRQRTLTDILRAGGRHCQAQRGACERDAER